MKTIYALIVMLLFVVLQISGQAIQNMQATILNVGGIEQIELKWQTINEYAWCYFNIEKDVNNQGNFSIINTNMQYAVGTTNSTYNYLYTDFGPFQYADKYCYRIAIWDDQDFDAICDYFGYSDTACVNYTAILTAEMTTVPYSIFPNPTTGNILINESKSINSIQIYNAIGEIIFNTTNPDNSNLFIIDVSNNPDGIYIIAITSDNKLYYHKLVIIKPR